jgi:phage terminase large subunit-like protein
MNIYELAALDPERRAKVLKKLNATDAEELLHNWAFFARPEQLPPQGDWRTWVFMGGRGSGKTKAGAEWVRDEVKKGAKRIALVGQTAADVREVMIDGESGLKNVCWKLDRDYRNNFLGRPEYQPSRRRLVWANGAIAHAYSAEDPEQLRGPQHDLAWADEYAAWAQRQMTWDMLQFGLRLRRSNGGQPRQLMTTTPKPLKDLADLIKRADTILTHGSTYRNSAFLSSEFIDAVRSVYEGTRLGRQELEGELLMDIEGAFFSQRNFDENRLKSLADVPDLDRVVVSLDPSGARSNDDGEADEIGIIVAGRKGSARDGKAFVLKDASMRGGPMDWAKVACNLYHAFNADCIVGEVNYGGAMVEATVKSYDPTVNFKEVRATRGKAIRAEPVSALYAKDRVAHVGYMNVLEDQMLRFTPDGYQGNNSPDHADALIWAISDLLLKPSALLRLVHQR